MDISATTVKGLRLSRGWTQQHLADACDISLRTVQRVEKDGSASNDTLLGLCAVFEIKQKTLLVIPAPSHQQMQQVSLQTQTLTLAIATLCGGCIGALIMFLVLA
ncbi:helix-turn-helix domain-containing protein [Shewanella sp. GutDb-MelDb]|uniref:helix-turn-helix domain-containing protein n=1 Tax=Shewanella sp. GutDb-MelDb TaxID=2058316 RepID=UPI000C7BF9C6|nr:helix-turn-helix transcriptional regulator [Shewanella sp. GutDb-MelDb]PKG55467.1 XRE family transcriptional regulator [Shewanella sp. GutDb-MelDb]